MVEISRLKEKILAGGELNDEEAMSLADITPSQEEELIAAAAEVTARFGSRHFDSCSIINARAGLCGEDCKWCAQSLHHKAKTDTYNMVGREVCMKMAEYNRSRGIGRFSLVTSGRALGKAERDTACSYYKELSTKGGMGLCASMGLLDRKALAKLREAGVTRYHCNIETAPSHFANLCTTHSIADKLSTIEAARAEGLEICCGGIIGMGETRRQRVEFALTLQKIKPVSIPLNLLSPIPGTALENAAPLSQSEILLTVAILRMINPKAVIRFAGGRAGISRETQIKALATGINGAIMGDLLTTVGSQLDDDIRMVEECGYEF